MATLKGQQMLRNPFLNKGTAFSMEERKKYNLMGLLPGKVMSLEEQEKVIYERTKTIEDNLDKHLYLMNIYDTNRVLFYYLVSKHVTEFLPIIYTPTIGDAVINYSKNYDTPKDAVFLSVDNSYDIKERIKSCMDDLDEIKLSCN